MARLHAYPSARSQLKRHLRLSSLHRASRLVVLAIFGMAGVFVALVALAFAIGSFGFSSDRLTAEAQAAISRMTGQPVETRFGPARVSLDHARLIALEVRDIEVAKAGEQAPVLEAGMLRFGMKVMPLLSGRLELGGAILSDARVNLAGLQPDEGSDWRGLLAAEGGVVDADGILAAAFDGIHAALDSLGRSGTAGFELRNVEIVLAEGHPLRRVHIVSARMARSRGGGLTLSGEVAADGHSVSFKGAARRPTRDRTGAEFTLAVNAAPDKAVAPREDPDDPDGPQFALGSATLTLEGTQGRASGQEIISAEIDIGDTLIKTRNSEPVVGKGRIEAVLAAGSGKIEFSTIDVSAGRTRLSFTGALGLMPPGASGRELTPYRFELVSLGSFIAPADANEQGLTAGVRVAGRMTPDGMRIIADEITVATDQGDVFGSGSLEVKLDQTPGISLAIAVPELPVSYAKSLWPWFAAPGARKWALANVFGGTVENSRLLLNARPGSLGPGKQLGHDEVSGHFEVRGTRFDVAGTIPPVRDAIGSINFRGTDVDIALTSGTVFMPSGRTLAARDGTLRLANAHLKPLIGDLEIDVEGAAGAVAEIATYEPINIARYIDMPPDELTGEVTGHISAGIPLQRDIDAKDLRWQVDLAYSGLSLAKPFEGQQIADAEGTIVARPEEARIEARATANGIPAEFSLVEPLEGDRSGRQLKARLSVDNSTRDRLVPGLSSILSGPFAVEIESLGKGRQKVAVDLRGAKLSLPWVGWSKDAGVPANAGFLMETTGGATGISDFELTGESFGASGSMKLDEQGLASARFSRFALNRGDDVAATIQRRGGGYSIGVTGKSMDARSVIRRFSHFAKGGGGTEAGGDAEDFDFSVEADVAEVTGFHDEKIRGLKLAYSGAGTTVGGLRASATTGSGGQVTVVDASAGGSRKVEMQAGDAGSLLRFLDVYKNLRGGTAVLSLSGPADGPLRGQLNARDFAVLNEDKLESIVSRAPPGSDRSLNQAVRRDIDLTRASFDQGAAQLELGDGYLTVTNGVVRGPTIGSTFQGTVFDKDGNMSITGTFMPAYGLNRLFGEIPLIGQLLGNGRDRGLIGITFRLAGKTSEPKLDVNPLSVVAPGIFRSIFEYR